MLPVGPPCHSHTHSTSQRAPPEFGTVFPFPPEPLQGSSRPEAPAGPQFWGRRAAPSPTHTHSADDAAAGDGGVHHRDGPEELPLEDAARRKRR